MVHTAHRLPGGRFLPAAGFIKFILDMLVIVWGTARNPYPVRLAAPRTVALAGDKHQLYEKYHA